MSRLRRDTALLLVAVLAAGFAAQVPLVGIVRAEAGGVPSPSTAVFADLVGHWAERDATLLWARGAVTAGGEGLFRPDLAVTRADFARILVLGLGEVRLTERLPVPFVDVEPERPDAVYIAHAAELGLVKGYGDGTFRPENPITRAEMVTMLVRALGDAAGGNPPPLDFRDADTIPWWASRHVAEAVRRGLVQGYEDQTFRPFAHTSRAEAAAFIVRMLQARATPFDFFGLFLGWGDGTVRVSLTLTGFDAAETGGRTVTLRLAPDVQLFRNGWRARPADLVVGDEVGVVLDARGQVSLLDAHLVTLSGTLKGVRWAGPVCYLSIGGQEAPVPVLPGAAVFRNGRPAALAEVEPGDRLYAVRAWASGWVRALLAVRTDLKGELSARDGAAVVVIPRGGELARAEPDAGEGGSSREPDARGRAPWRVEVDPRAAIFLDGKVATLGDLEPGDQVGLARDGRGRVVYLEAWRTVKPADAPVPAAREGAPVPTAREDAPVSGGREDAPVPVARETRWAPAAGRGSAVAAGRVEVPLPGRRPGLLGGEKEEARVSLDLTTRGQEAIRLGEFLAGFPRGKRPDGTGITIAIIDTGIDPSHPDLVSCPDGSPKLVDWVDFSGEGRVEVTDEGRAQGDLLPTPLGTFRLGSVRSVGGIYRWGIFREEELDRGAPHEQDLNRNGHRGDIFPVFLVDTAVAGQYDTVLVDTDRDQDLGDEVALVPVRVTAARGEMPRVAWFGTPGGGVPFVLADVDPGGRWVDLGFDGHGHGTHVAGTAAAWNPAGLRGVAPGARLMALKALKSSGDGSWSTIAQAMVYAAEHGAQVVGISAGGKGDSSWGGSPESELMSQLADQYGVTFVVAAGNGGPGLGTSSPPGDGRTSIITGAYVSPAMWEAEFGYQVPEEGLWDFSGVGPRVDGTLSPEVVAPGSATSCVPRWLAPGGYQPMDGTSVAVPYLTGMLALLRQAAAAAGYRLDAGAWREAVIAGARPLRGYTLVEQGYGLVDAVRTWAEVRRLAERPAAPAVRVSAYLDPGVCGADAPGYAEVEGGVYARALRPGRVEATALNPGEDTVALDLSGDADWVLPARQRLFLYPREARSFGIEYRIPDAPGLYAAFVRGSDGQRDRFAFLSTLVVAEALGTGPDGEPTALAREHTGSLAPGAWKRYFFRVPAGAGLLRLTVGVPRGDWGYRGRVRVHLYRPDGGRQAVSDYVGAGATAPGADIEVPFPQAGVWEAVVQSAPSLSYYGVDRSLYTLRADLQAVLLTPAELRLWVPPGPETEVRVPLEVVNRYGFFTGVLRGMGLARAGAVPERGQSVALTVTRARPAVFPLPAVPADTVEMWLQLGDVVPQGADLDLYLYRRDPDSGEWQEVACATCPGLGEERITLTFPAPGEYVAYVEVRDRDDPVDVELRYGFVTDRGQVSVEDQPVPREPGQRWSARLVVRVPEEEGFYTGRVMIYDTVAGRSLGSVPLLVQRGYPLLVAQAVPGAVGGAGGRVAVHVREAAGLGKVELRAVVNGRVYQVVDGEVLVPVSGGKDLVRLDMRLESCSYALWEGSEVLPAVAPGYIFLSAGGSATAPLPPGSAEAGGRGAGALPGRPSGWDRHHLILEELLVAALKQR